MQDDRLPVHLGDTEVVDGVLVRESQRSAFAVAVIAGGAVIATAAVVVAVMSARRIAG